MNAYGLNNEAYITRMINKCKSTGVNINLENPRTIQEKLCWLNIYDVNPLKVKCADKILVRDYCKDVIGKDLCVPLIGTYNSSSEIDWETLPNKFVAKCNHGSGMNIIVKDKSQIDFNKAKELLDHWLTVDFTFQNGFESHYHGIERRILIEEFIESENISPYDYKFSCFNGEPKFMQIFSGRFTNALSANYYDMGFNFLNISRNDIRNNKDIIHEKPKSFDLMKEYAKKLSKPFKYVRVDFYEINGEPHLGELTFTPGAMLFSYLDKSQEIMVGDMLSL